MTGTSKYIQDIHPEDVYWCMADIGWITGHSYIVYGPLALATSSVIYEGIPTHPDAGRSWRIAEELGVNIFHTSPTAIRALRRAGEDIPKKYNYHFKHMTTVGEPIEPEVWRWYYNVVGKKEAVIVDTWWQTETGGFLCSTVPALAPMKPGSAGPGLPGIYPIIFDDEGNELPAGAGKAGNICIRNPWPGLMQTIWGDPERMTKVYFQRYCKNKDSKDWHDWPYLAGDGAVLRPGRLLPHPGAHRRRHQRGGSPPGHQGTGERGAHRARGGRGRRRARSRRNQGPHPRTLRVPETRVHSHPELGVRNRAGPERPHRSHRQAQEVSIVPDMPDKVGKDHAPDPGGHLHEGRTGDITTLANPDVVEIIRGRSRGGIVPRSLESSVPWGGGLSLPAPAFYPEREYICSAFLAMGLHGGVIVFSIIPNGADYREFVLLKDGQGVLLRIAQPQDICPSSTAFIGGLSQAEPLHAVHGGVSRCPASSSRISAPGTPGSVPAFSPSSGRG